jgi:predicted ribosome quality control (RQC) complex YloA/Tae2 family protein
VPNEVTERAAGLAAWYSKARNAARVEVHVCRAADVKKARGAPAGQVQISRFKAVRVAPAPFETDETDSE